ncbi:MAG: carboxylesterase/lipase family protein [Chitinophagales bacterium]|nr:carboxylesterase/lipase family protein [Chitinophagales bacterium]
MLRWFSICLFIMASLICRAADEHLTVSTKLGLLSGYENNGISIWKGIPYAKAPVGDLRFRAPQPMDPWQGVKACKEYCPTCVQYKGPLRDGQPEIEDCLYLNVWSPAADGKKRPVMVWIHGGGFIGGAGSNDMYEATKMSKRGDVVVVTINYRLGPLGFLYFKDIAKGKEGFEDNLGIKDQVAALQWVKDNISAFGGDPNQVTIFGESAGAISVQTLMAVPAAEGLFQKAIVQSGNSDILWSPQAATMVTKRYLELLKISPDSLEALKRIDKDTLATYLTVLLKELFKEPKIMKLFAPTIDGEFIPEPITTAIAKGASNHIPLLIGTNKDEANLFATKRLGLAPTNAKDLAPYLLILNDSVRNKLISAYKAYPKRSGIMSLLTDATFAIPSIRFAEGHSLYAPTYMYRFDWSSFPLKLLKLGACHGIDIPFVFGNFGNGLGKRVTTLAAKKPIRRLSNEVQTAWINFAKTGNPNGKAVTEWPRYDAQQRQTLVFGKKSKVQKDPKATERTAWEGVELISVSQ